MPRRVTGYVMSPGRPAIMVPVDRGEAGWEFGEGYASVQAEAGLALPTTLADAIAQRDFQFDGWLVGGLPELPTLYKYISPRTVFEGDEAALLNSASAVCSTALWALAISRCGKCPSPGKEALRKCSA